MTDENYFVLSDPARYNLPGKLSRSGLYSNSLSDNNIYTQCSTDRRRAVAEKDAIALAIKSPAAEISEVAMYRFSAECPSHLLSSWTVDIEVGPVSWDDSSGSYREHYYSVHRLDCATLEDLIISLKKDPPFKDANMVELIPVEDAPYWTSKNILWTLVAQQR